MVFCSILSENHEKSKKMKKIISLLLIVALFCSCNEYQKALKSEDVAVKFDMGTKLYDAGKYAKAIRIFEQIAPAYRGKPQAEKLLSNWSLIRRRLVCSRKHIILYLLSMEFTNPRYAFKVNELESECANPENSDFCRNP